MSRRRQMSAGWTYAAPVFHAGAAHVDHGQECHCGRPAKWHVSTMTTCSHVCGIHRRSMSTWTPTIVAVRIVG